MDYNFIQRQETEQQVERFVIHKTLHRAGDSELRSKERKEIRANGGCLGYPEARKDVVSCDKRRGTANRF